MDIFVFVVTTLISVLFGLLCRRMASTRQRDKTLWFIAGLFIGPFAALLLLLLGTHTKESVEA